MTVTACATVSSSVPHFPNYSPEFYKKMAKELDEHCPITVDTKGNTIHECPSIDQFISDMRVLKKQLQVK